MAIRYMKGVISNVKIHQKIQSSGDKEKTETYTKYIHAFDINGMGMKYESGKPALISDNDLLSIAYKDGLFGKKIKGMWNCSNMTYSGDISLPYFFLVALVGILFALVIFWGFPTTAEFFKTPVNFYSLPEESLLIIPMLGGMLSVFFLMLGINTRRMISRVKAL